MTVVVVKRIVEPAEDGVPRVKPGEEVLSVTVNPLLFVPWPS